MYCLRAFRASVSNTQCYDALAMMGDGHVCTCGFSRQLIVTTVCGW
jgi:hypothetical protein